MTRTVKAVAKAAGVSVRTLHHYDAIGLLKPSGASQAGYRLYSREDVERLQHILFYRELEFSLAEIGALLEEPGLDRRAALERQRDALQARQAHTGVLIQTITKTLESLRGGRPMKDHELFQGTDPSQYEEEVRQRWGDTEAYKESKRRTKNLKKEDWDRLRAEGQDIAKGIAARMDKGPQDAEVQQWVGRHHQHICSRFYACSTQMYRGLAQMWAEDERFAAYWNAFRPGMTPFMVAAANVYCDALDRQAAG